MSSSELLRVAGLGVAWQGRPVLEEVGFTVERGEYVVLMGPNGSGKTTLLRQIAGLDPPGKGTITFEGRRVDRLPPHRRGIGLLAQEVLLLSGRTVRENIAYGPEVAGWPPAEVDRTVDGLLDLLRLKGLGDRRPTELSGGERQRAALARTLAPRPALVLLDEPLTAVDPELRGELRGELRRVFRRLGVAAIHVTHDREEGLWLGDRVLLLLGGRIARAGPPGEVFAAPRSVRAARFLGYNVLASPTGPFAVHPREVRVGPEGTGTGGQVVSSGPIGGEWLAEVETAGGERVEVRGAGETPPAVGTRVGLAWEREVPLSPGDDSAPDPAEGG